MTAEELYKEGNRQRRLGNFQQAMNCYMEALDLDPESPAKEALEMMKNIMEFYHKDAYNP